MIDLLLALGIALIVLGLMTIVRLALGPTIADRAIGLDTLNTLVVAAMVVLGAAFDQVILVDIAIVYALLSFIGTLYLAKYMEGRL